MRGRTITWKFPSVGSTILSCLLLMTITSGCKKETDEVSGGQKINDTGSTGALAFELKEIPDSDVAWPEPPLPRALKFPGKVRRAEIEIDGNEYGVFLSPHPRNDICLFPKDRPMDYPWWEGAHQLNSMHVIDGTYYHFATNSTGDKLFVRPYEGRLGTFEIGAGGRDTHEFTITGSLLSKDTVVPIGGELENGWPKPVQSCQVPEGDYLPAYMSISLGTLNKEISDDGQSESLSTLSIWISDNYHSGGKAHDMDRPKVYGIKIRKDKPFVLDFSNEPEVVFASPTKGQRVQPGDELLVKAVLTDPKLHIVIGIRQEKQREEFTNPDGKRTVKESVGPIHPTVFITRSDGEKVVEGVMPFG
ncbi:MAG: hypothetical protein WBC05_01555 [Sedimentisphaerales bacterium]